MEYDMLLEQLKISGCRITPQRKTLIQILVDHPDQLLSPEQLTNLCQTVDKDLNATTVYRNLELLIKNDLVYTEALDKTTKGYKIKCHTGHHHHMICISCRKMFPIDYCPMCDDLLSKAKDIDFKVTEHQLTLYGYCKDCTNE